MFSYLYSKFSHIDASIVNVILCVVCNVYVFFADVIFFMYVFGVCLCRVRFRFREIDMILKLLTLIPQLIRQTIQALIETIATSGTS